MSPSIRHNLLATALPDFRNLGVWLRILLGANLLGLLWVLARNDAWPLLAGEFVDIALWLEPPLFLLLPLLHLLHPRLAALPVRLGRLAVVLMVMLVVGAQHLLFSTALSGLINVATLSRSLLWAALGSIALLIYFALRSTLYSPALAEARLLALTARIRPHFLYNSLNAVLGVIRSDPRRAERVLEELAELFRMLMRDHRELVSLADELRLCEGYLAVENLRLGERLQVRWVLPLAGSVEHQALLAVQVPALLLQPLLENAVYHGIEPVSEAGEIIVHATRDGEQLLLEVDNPLAASAAAHPGNRMALDNIRERLMLFFDLEARLEIELREGRHRVRIRLPWRTKNLQTGQQSREEA